MQDPPATIGDRQLLTTAKTEDTVETETEKGTAPWFETVSVSGVLAVLAGVSGKFRAEGETTNAPTSGVPSPVRRTIKGKVGGFELMLRTAFREPVAEGVNVTLSVQVPLAGMVPPEQVSALTAKSGAFTPPQARGTHDDGTITDIGKSYTLRPARQHNRLNTKIKAQG